MCDAENWKLIVWKRKSIERSFLYLPVNLQQQFFLGKIKIPICLVYRFFFLHFGILSFFFPQRNEKKKIFGKKIICDQPTDQRQNIQIAHTFVYLVSFLFNNGFLQCFGYGHVWIMVLFSVKKRIQFILIIVIIIIVNKDF